jgi:hypothetical protein
MSVPASASGQLNHPAIVVWVGKKTNAAGLTRLGVLLLTYTNDPLDEAYSVKIKFCRADGTVIFKGNWSFSPQWVVVDLPQAPALEEQDWIGPLASATFLRNPLKPHDPLPSLYGYLNPIHVGHACERVRADMETCFESGERGIVKLTTTEVGWCPGACGCVLDVRAYACSVGTHCVCTLAWDLSRT